MKFLHSMIRVKDLDRSLNFYKNLLGLKEFSRRDHDKGQFTLVFLGTETEGPILELTYNWDSSEDYGNARNFGHLAFKVPDIYHKCAQLKEAGVDILRPPRDGHMAFVKCPDQISIELLQDGEALPPQEPWASMENQGTW